VDWWLFLFPDGIGWGSPDSQQVHVLLGHVARWPGARDPGRARHSLGRLARRLRRPEIDWRRVARLGRVEAAGYLNPLFGELLDRFPY
jgi:hypothetical protein